MAKVIGSIKVDTEKCKGCSLCIAACPTDVIALSSDVNTKGYNYAELIDMDGCTGCTNCSVVCPDGVITVYRMRI
ncbi:MAG: 4Fe-4S dicluster domain-containing protein [Bacteroidota bacterium]